MMLAILLVLSIVLTYPRPTAQWLTTPSAVLALAVATVLAPALTAWWTSRRTLSTLDRQPEDPFPGQRVFYRGSILTQGVVAASQSVLLLGTAWMPLCNQLPVIGGWVLAPTLATLAPLLLAVMAAWIGLFSGDRAIRQLALEYHLYRGKPVRPVWSLGEYLGYSLRHQLLFILLPMLLMLAARDVIVRYERRLVRPGFEYLPDLLLGGVALIVAVIAPVIIRHVWDTQRLPSGPLRDRLEWLCDKIGVHCREILIWRSGGMVVNAAVMGVAPRLRYVLITDGMLEQMTDTQIEAVFGHEAGHVKKNHIPYFLLFALISGCLVTVFSVRVRENQALYQLLAALFGVVLLFKWGVVFSWISRLFEWQADIFGTRTLALAGLPCNGTCALHGAGSPAKPLTDAAVCATAAQVFSSALNDVAVLNGISPDVGGWRHPSISSRSRFLHKVAQEPAMAARFERRIGWVKLGIAAAALLGCLWAAYEMKLWRVLELVREAL